MSGDSESGSKERDNGYDGCTIGWFIALAFASCALFFPLVMFDVIVWWLGALIVDLIIVAAVFVVTKLKRKRMGRKSLAVTCIVTGVVLVFMLLLAYVMSAGCVSALPDEIYFRGFSRDSCRDETICHVYLTAGEDVSRNIIVHFHSYYEYENVVVYYDTVSRTSLDSFAYETIPTSYYHHRISGSTQRYLHYAYLYDLQPDTQYYFAISIDGTMDGEVRKFKTMVGDNSNFTFASGGDLGLLENFSILLNLSSTKEPAFLALGGDIAYANGFVGCYGRWDNWLRVLENTLVTQTGNMIPVITAIGNHEIGGFNQNSRKETFYSAYFVHERLGDRDPFDLDRYHVHLLGSESILFSLDSGVVEEVGGDQAEWLDAQFAMYPNRHNSMAIYHAGLYPSYRPFHGPIHTSLRENWQPIFDDHRLKVALENHDHTYKRTKPIYNNQTVGLGEGTIYMGDGAMGSNSRLPVLDEEHGWYLDEVSGENFYLEIRVSSNAIHVQANDVNDTAIDSINVPTNY